MTAKPAAATIASRAPMMMIGGEIRESLLLDLLGMIFLLTLVRSMRIN